jgi:hypothetical protein
MAGRVISEASIMVPLMGKKLDKVVSKISIEQHQVDYFYWLNSFLFHKLRNR